jgi:hypothetical protein
VRDERGAESPKPAWIVGVVRREGSAFACVRSYEMKSALVLPILVILTAAWAWWRLHRALGRCSNQTLRLAGRALLPWALTLATVLLITGSIDRGTWQCEVCGKLVEHTSFLSVPIASREPTEPEDVLTAAHRFEAWYTARFGAHDNHEWSGVGCHYRKSWWWKSVACAEEPLLGWYIALPRVPDQAIARAMLEKFRDAGHRKRVELVAGLRGAPWDALESEEGVPAPERFLDEHAVWLASHPEWQ